MTNESVKSVSTTVTSFRIIDVLKELNGATVSDVAEELDIAVSTAHRHLGTLVEEGFVLRKDNTYDIALRFLDYGIYARNKLRYYDIAKNQVDILADETGEKIRLTALEDDYCVLLYRRMGNHPLQTSAEIGNRRYLHQLAAGKSILASLPESEVERIIERRGLPRRTENTITEKAKLLDELELIRERGYAYNRGESIDGLNAVGACFRDEDGHPLGALSISGPANRLQGSLFKEELPNLLLGAINEVEINLKYAKEPSWS
jgi:DNA-binding IclR family transcriptional regulator